MTPVYVFNILNLVHEGTFIKELKTILITAHNELASIDINYPYRDREITTISTRLNNP